MRVFYSPKALADLDRLFEFAIAHDAALATEAVDAIISAVGILTRHPFIGRSVQGALRELVISHGRTGYLALYRVDRSSQTVQILTIRHQREAGYE